MGRTTETNRACRFWYSAEPTRRVSAGQSVTTSRRHDHRKGYGGPRGGPSPPPPLPGVPGHPSNARVTTASSENARTGRGRETGVERDAPQPAGRPWFRDLVDALA